MSCDVDVDSMTTIDHSYYWTYKMTAERMAYEKIVDMSLIVVVVVDKPVSDHKVPDSLLCFANSWNCVQFDCNWNGHHTVVFSCQHSNHLYYQVQHHDC